MRVVVCVRQGLDGELGPFDAAAYESALRIEGAEVILLSMGPPSAKDFLLNLTRLGAKEAILLSDPAFAGADTLATAYTLSLEIKRLSPDLVLVGRQTLVGDTGQTGAMLSVFSSLSLVTGVMSIAFPTDGRVSCETREEGTVSVPLPALLTVERINILRLPRLRSRPTSVSVLDAAALEADIARCGLKGSPTRVKRSFENEAGKRKCRMITMDELDDAVRFGLARTEERVSASQRSAERLPRVIAVGESVREMAESVSDDVTVIPPSDEEEISRLIDRTRPSAVLFGCDAYAKRISARLAAMRGWGLCADCTALGCEEGRLLMHRPALAGSVLATVVSLTEPALATLRTEAADTREVTVAAGYGVRDRMDEVRALADRYSADLAATRKMVDHGYLPYSMQVGLTGRTVSPSVYIALGISGAVHHIVGMQRAGTVIAVNPDRDAPIFEYADFGIVGQF